MLAECVIICALMYFIGAGYAVTKRKYAVAVIPLLILPTVNIIAYFVAGPLADIFPMPPFTAYAAIDIIALIGTGVAVSFTSLKFRSKRIRAIYVGISLIFEILLAAILIYDMFGTYYPA